VSRHTALKQSQASSIVGFLFEIELSTVLHKLLELVGLAAAEFLKGSLNFLFFDSSVLLILGAARESLPGKLTLEKVQNNMANSLQVVSS